MAKRHKSAIKADKQSKRKRERNRATLSKVKSVMKKTSSAVESKQIEAGKTLLPQLTSIIQKAVSKGMLHKNTAARKISRMATKINGLIGKPA
ncbi:MAG: 30S ribosomal protein S20 [Nitrospirae bacterium]|nr:30S ribosomal protein S20 [Nitrospirota bacterium]